MRVCESHETALCVREAASYPETAHIRRWPGARTITTDTTLCSQTVTQGYDVTVRDPFAGT